jgi:hypothetical protein
VGYLSEHYFAVVRKTPLELSIRLSDWMDDFLHNRSEWIDIVDDFVPAP